MPIMSHALRLVALTLFLTLLSPSAAAQDHAEDPASVHIARLIYGQGKSAVCFSDAFLTLAAEKTGLDLHPRLVQVQLASRQLHDHPIAIMTGEGGFTLSQAERKQLKRYLERGGFLLASAGCSSRTWASSFRRAITDLYPNAELVRLDAEHPVYHTVFDIGAVAHRKGLPRLPHLEALVLDGRIAAIFCPDGLNDTDALGGACCCCGGNEVKAAPQLNTNLIAYALTQ
jgi:hypothetical protein